MSSSRYFERQHSAITATTTPQNLHHRVGAIVGACLGAAGAILLVGLVLFWLLLRHRHRTATGESAKVQNVVSRSWVPCDLLGGHGVAVIANHPSRTIDLAGADTDTASVDPASDETSETKQWNKSTEVLDISLENAPRSPLRPLPLSEPIEPLCIRTDVQPELSPPSSKDSTPVGSSRFPIRPLPTPPTRPQVRRQRSSKAEEALRESGRGPLPHRKISADDVHAAHSVNSISCEADGCAIAQHHNGGMNAWTDFPPPYSENLPAQEIIPSTSQRP